MRLSAALALSLLLAAGCTGKGNTDSPDAKKVNDGAAGVMPAQTDTASTTAAAPSTTSTNGTTSTAAAPPSDTNSAPATAPAGSGAPPATGTTAPK